MTHKEILEKVDHTLLVQTATWEDVRELCDEAVAFHTASVCIPPCYVKKAKAYVGDQMKICTVIGFPNGSQTMETKIFETEEALRNGADELDMVINIGALKEKNSNYVEQEICALKAIAGEHILKIIIETCLLNETEKVKMCEIITRTGADFIKTSTGFSKAGATLDDVKLLKEHIGSKIQIKAAGGIRSFEDAEAFLAEGVSRLGTSCLVKLEKQSGIMTKY